MAGTVNISLQQQFDSQGLPLGGGRLYIFQSGTSTPQSAYRDIALTIAHTNPVELDSSGRVPQMFFADGTIKLRLTSRSGAVVVFEADFLPVLGASSGGSGGSSVDATTVLATGDVKFRYGTGALSGFVRANGRTIGSASSTATERASADCQALFEYLWNNDSTLTVSTGRGASSLADWTANKTITLPDMRGRILAGMDDMGATSATRLTVGASTTLGAAFGAQQNNILTANLPITTPSGTISGTVSFTPAGTLGGTTAAFTPSGTVAIIDPGHPHTVSGNFNTSTTGAAGTTNSLLRSGVGGSLTNYTSFASLAADSNTTGITATFSGATISASLSTNGTFIGTPQSPAISAAFTGTPFGSASPFTIVPPTMVVTLYIKL